VKIHKDVGKPFLLIIIVLIINVVCSTLSETPKISAPVARQESGDFTNTLSPVYAPLAEHIVERFDLAEKEGIGIDIGGGVGNLVVELAKLTSHMHWINADIDPLTLPKAAKKANSAGVGDRISFQLADVHSIPYSDNYADIFVSRGSFHFWENHEKAFAEIYRVLKPGGIAFIGRGLSENMPVDLARDVRNRQGGGPKYDKDATAEHLEEVMKALNIIDYKIELPAPESSDGINYGIWLEFHKPPN